MPAKRIDFQDSNSKLEEAFKYFSDTSNIVFVEKDETIKDVIGNVYVLYSNNVAHYIGERLSSEIINRLNDHFNGSSMGTHTKYNEITLERQKGNKVGYKVMMVSPECFRYAVETFLIQTFKTNDWNIRDKKND